jgi:hypothetical protein
MIGLCLLLWPVFMSLASAQAPAPSKELVSTPGQAFLEQANLPAGVYEVNFRMQVDRSENSVTPLALLSVNVPDYPQVIYRQITPLNFGSAGTSQDFKFIFDNFKAQNVRAAVDLVENKVAVPKLTIDRITLMPVQAPCIGTVWPGKILYHTRENAQGMVSVYNGASEPRSVTLRCALESDIDRTRPLQDTKLTLAAGERREVPVTWNTGREEFGFDLSAILLDAQGKEISRGREYFSVSDSLWAVSIIETGRGSTVPNGVGPNQSIPVSEVKKSEDLLAADLAKPVAPVYWNYGNYLEFYAWSPDDFFNLTPTQDYWYSGTGNYTMGKRWLQLTIDWLHRRGMRATTYANPFSCGYDGDLVFQKHPEWFQYDQSGEPVVGSYYQKKLEIGRTIGAVPPWPLQLVPYALLISVNIARLDAIDAQTEQIAKSQKMFGWDGVRFDNGPYTAVGYDSDGRRIDGNDPKKKDAIEVRAWARMRDGLQAKFGRSFGVGDNGDYEITGADRAVWNEVCRKGGLLMEEIPRSSYSAQSPHNRWQDYMTYYAKISRIIHGLGGHHLIIGIDVQNPVDHLYLNVFTYAIGAHPYGNYHSLDLPLGNYAQFATRYSSLIWDVDRLKPLANPETRLEVKSPGPLWWKELASTRQTAAGKRQYIVHLVNPPVQERIYTDPTNQVPSPLQNVEVTLRPDQGEKISRAWLISADPTTHQTELPIATNEGRVSVTVPKVDFWSIVVFE